MIKIIRLFKGGNNTTQVVESIPAWMKPYLTKAMGSSEALYEGGKLGQVAGVNDNLLSVQTQGVDAIRQATGQGVDNVNQATDRLKGLATSGGYDTTALKDAAILEAGQRTAQLTGQMGAAGTLGSARQAVRQGASDAATSAQFATIDRDAAQRTFDNKMKAESLMTPLYDANQRMAGNAVNAIGQIGTSERGIAQEFADKDFKALQQYASTIYGNPVRQSGVSGGGGK
jgi:hypothetical protein